MRMTIDTARTHYGLAFEAYAVGYVDVLRIDNMGEDCGYCDDVTAVNTRTVYGTDRHGEWWSVECCNRCVPRLVVESLDASYGVRVERLRTLAVWVPSEPVRDPLLDLLDDDRMHGPECVCVHPDAR